MPDFELEAVYPAPIAGVDEAGRGPWAGPVVAAAVILDPASVPDGLNDSKKLTARRRAALFDTIYGAATVGVGIGSVEEIDRLNIARANDLAMARAVSALPVEPAFLLIDGRFVPHNLDLPARAVVRGDGKSLSIAAASIIAKVTRDRIMADLAAQYPGYGWGTKCRVWHRPASPGIGSIWGNSASPQKLSANSGEIGLGKRINGLIQNTIDGFSFQDILRATGRGSEQGKSECAPTN